MKNLSVSIYKQKCFLHLIQQPKYEMVMPCKADYSPAKSFYDVKNLSGLIYFEIVPFILVELEFEFALNNYRIQ